MQSIKNGWLSLEQCQIGALNSKSIDMGGDVTPTPICSKPDQVVNALNSLSCRLGLVTQGPPLTHHILCHPRIQVFTLALCEITVSCGIFPSQQARLFVFIPLDLAGVPIHMEAMEDPLISAMNLQKGASYPFMATSSLPKTFSSVSFASFYEGQDKEFSNR